MMLIILAIMLVILPENLQPELKQCKNCGQWFDKASFPAKRGWCRECVRTKARELSRRPDQVQKRKERRANFTPEQQEAERRRGRRRYANRTPEQEQRAQDRRQARKEIDNARARELRAQSPERKKRQHDSVYKSKLKHEYGITPEIHELMYKDQEGKCYFCDKEKRMRGRGCLVIDHKKGGFVRGLLCQPCNANYIDEYKRLPREFQDSPRANAYLRRGETGEYVESIKKRLQTDE